MVIDQSMVDAIDFDMPKDTLTFTLSQLPAHGKMVMMIRTKKVSTAPNGLCYIELGDIGGCNGDKKHCCFCWELNYGLNLCLKKR